MLFEDSADVAALSSQALRQHKGNHKRPRPDQGQVGKWGLRDRLYLAGLFLQREETKDKVNA